MDQPHAAPVPPAPPVSTTALDWADQARRDGWRLTDGTWRRDDRADAYDDGAWVYLGGGVWEDAYIASLTPDERHEVLTRYGRLQAEIADTDESARRRPGQGS